jgi:hypothetical protein
MLKVEDGLEGTRQWQAENGSDHDDDECHANYGDDESYDFDISVKDLKIS